MSVAVGLLLVAYGWWDLFHELFHPGGSGRLSLLARAVIWPIFRRSGLLLPLAGPVIIVTVIVAWVVLFTVGWALVYWPFLDSGFYFSTRASGGFGEALYVSGVTLATLGYGDIVPIMPLLRAATSIEAMSGFALLTASLSWVLSTYPVLGRRRTLAAHIRAVYATVSSVGQWEALSDDHRAASLRQVALGLVRVRADLAQFPVTYYFTSRDLSLDLPAVLPLVTDWIDRAPPEEPRAVRDAHALARAALDQFAAQLRKQFLINAPDEARGTLAAYAADHVHEQHRKAASPTNPRETT